MALGSTQSLTEMSTSSVRRTTLPPSGVYCLEILEPEPAGTLRACTVIALPF